MSKRRRQLTHGHGRKMSPALIRALDHPLRRETLRRLHGEATELSPAELSPNRAVISQISYHLRELAELKVVRQTRTEQVRGSTAHFYTSLVADNDLVARILAYTENDDQIKCAQR